MKAIICAAGEGKRLRPHTNEYPKVLLPIGEKTIIEHMLDNFSLCGITDVIIVVGYKEDVVRKKLGEKYKNCKITYVHNRAYKHTNNSYSLWLARDHVNDGMIFFNGDIIFHHKILDGVLTNNFSNSVVVDQSIELEEDAMKVSLKRTLLQKIGKKINEGNFIFKKKADAWAIGIYKLSQGASEAYFREAENFFLEGKKNISFVAPLEMVKKDFPIKKHKVLRKYLWVEVDTPKDYEKAQNMIDNIIKIEPQKTPYQL